MTGFRPQSGDTIRIHGMGRNSVTSPIAGKPGSCPPNGDHFTGGAKRRSRRASSRDYDPALAQARAPGSVPATKASIRAPGNPARVRWPELSTGTKTMFAGIG